MISSAIRCKLASRLLSSLVLFVGAICLSSCVHEWPEPLETRSVTLTVHHTLPWEYRDFNTGIGLTRTEESNDPNLCVRYIYRVYPAGTNQIPVSETVEYRSDLTLADFTTTLAVPAGDYDIWVWTDFVEKDTETGLYYDASSFRAITYKYPYQGDTMRKDAFAGKTEVNVPASIDEVVSIDAEVTVERPLTGYVFISGDLTEFVRGEIARRKIYDAEIDTELQIPTFDFSEYKVKVSYTGYLPCEYDMFKGKPVDSATGVSYMADIRAISETKAAIGFDLFFINGKESSVRVALDIYGPDGERIAGTQNIDIPVNLSTITLVRGNFLTTKASGGVGIDPGFEGEFNIPIN